MTKAEIKHLRSLLTDSKYRAKHQQTVIDGQKFVTDYCNFIGQPVKIIISEKLVKTDLLLPKDLIEFISDDLLQRLAPVKRSSGILAIVKIPKTKSIKTFDKSVILLDRIQDPTNLGAIMRSAAAVEIDDIILSSNSVDAFNPSVIRASAGAIFKLNIHQNINLKKIMTEHLELIYVATSLDANTSLYDLNCNQNIAWIFGNEGGGIHPDIIQLANQLIFIPQSDGVESLNVGVSAAICLYEQYRQMMR